MDEKLEYISTVLEEEFVALYWQFKESGLLDVHLRRMLVYCEPVFEELNFNQGNENRFLRYAIIGSIGDFVSEIENVSDGLQQQAEASG